MHGPPLTSVRDITQDEIKKYREQTKWINNPDFQPQDHEEACHVLGIANPDVPRMEGFFGHIMLDIHQPTGIHSLYKFEESCVGGGLLADDVGLGKTIQLVGLLLLRSNQRREALSRGEQVIEARPTLIVVPQGLIPQWRDEITSYTDRFHVAVYYGPTKNQATQPLATLARPSRLV
jgi:SNF2 family DNA or RNA helicase